MARADLEYLTLFAKMAALDGTMSFVPRLALIEAQSPVS